MIKAYISANKIKKVSGDGSPIFYSFDYLRKCKNTVLYGMKRVDFPVTAHCFHFNESFY